MIEEQEEQEYLVTNLIKYAECTEQAKKERKGIKLYAAGIIAQVAMLALIAVLSPSAKILPALGATLMLPTGVFVIMLKHIGIKTNNEKQAKEALNKVLESDSVCLDQLKDIVTVDNESGGKKR